MRTHALKSERNEVGSHSADAIDSGKQRPKGWTITPEAGEEGGYFESSPSTDIAPGGLCAHQVTQRSLWTCGTESSSRKALR